LPAAGFALWCRLRFTGPVHRLFCRIMIYLSLCRGTSTVVKRGERIFLQFRRAEEKGMTNG
ncbi:hypothetical protein ABH20_10115, partial [Geobacillus sp. T6]|uniref:hypothetical protein n=1 Tax=Geobacillus sp. T6 TaxID=1659191 RepID=UPI00064ABCAE